MEIMEKEFVDWFKKEYGEDIEDVYRGRRDFLAGAMIRFIISKRVVKLEFNEEFKEFENIFHRLKIMVDITIFKGQQNKHI